MSWELLFIFGVPLLFAAVLLAMYKFGVGTTDWSAYPSPERQPYKEPSDREKVRTIAIVSGILYLILLFAAGPFAAAVLLAALLAFQLSCVLIFTAVQEVVFWIKGPKLDPETRAIVARRPFLRRLLWNFLNSFDVYFHIVP